MLVEYQQQEMNSSAGIPPVKPWERQQLVTTDSVLSVVTPENAMANGNVVNSSRIIPASNSAMPSGYWNSMSTNRYYPQSYPNYSNMNSLNQYDTSGLSNQIMPSGTVLGDTEERVRKMLSGITSVVRAFSGVAQMLDSTVYAAWSSVMAVVAVGEQFKYLRQEHLQYWINALKLALNWFISTISFRRSEKGLHEGSISDKSENILISGQRTQRTLPNFVVPFLVAGSSFLLWKLALQIIKNNQNQSLPARAIYPFTAVDSRCLPLAVGDDLQVIENSLDSDSGWMIVRNIRTMKEGAVPSAYVKIVESHV